VTEREESRSRGEGERGRKKKMFPLVFLVSLCPLPTDGEIKSKKSRDFVDDGLQF
jgi:hypothetical protein